MPIERFTSITQVNSEGPLVPNPLVALARMVDLVSLAKAERPPLFEPGVYRYRSIEDAAEVREAQTIRRAKELHARRAAVRG